MSVFKNFYQNGFQRPLALSGAALGTATLGNVWGMFEETAIGFSFTCWWLKYITISFAILIVILILLKYIFTPKILVKEFKDPTLSNFIPTIFMTCFVISGFFGDQNLRMLQLIIWLLCVILHLVYIVIFLVLQIYHFKWENYIASWFVPPIGIVVACVMSKNVGINISADFALGMHQLSQFCWYLGFAFYVIMLPFMIYKYTFTSHLEHKKIPAYGIMAAPPNLLLAGYFSTFSSQEIAKQHDLFIYVLAPLGIFFTLCVYISMFKTFRTKFVPLFACYTFPLAIGMVAMIKLSTWIVTNFSGYDEFAIIIKSYALTETIAGTIIILLIDFGLIIYSIYHVYYKHSNKAIKSKFIKYFV